MGLGIRLSRGRSGYVRSRGCPRVASEQGGVQGVSEHSLKLFIFNQQFCTELFVLNQCKYIIVDVLF